MTAKKKRRGRPLGTTKFKTPKELQEAVDKYFDTEKQPTLAGLAYHIGIDRQTLYNYKNRDNFFDIIKKATDKVASVYEGRLIYNNNSTGVIFALKNMGWTDRHELEVSGNRIKVGLDDE